MKKHPELKDRYKEFENSFKALLEQDKIRRVSLEAFLKKLSGKGKLLFLIFFVLPASQIVGINVFFDMLICYVGLRISFGKRSIWLPQFLRHKKVPSYFLKKSIKQLFFWLKILRRWSRPRGYRLFQAPSTTQISGVMIALVGFLMAIAPPTPLIGIVATIAILCIGIGLLNDDEIYLIAGYISTFGYLYLVIFSLKYISLAKILEWLKGGG